MAIKFCSIIASCTLCFCFIFTTFTGTSVSSSLIPSYSDHCSSMVPESTPTGLLHATDRFLQMGSSFYTGGETLFTMKGSSDQQPTKRFLSFYSTSKTRKTVFEGVYKVHAYLEFQSLDQYYVRSYFRRANPRLGSLRFLLNGFWSESSGKLCMVGSASWFSKEGNSLKLYAVLKLHYARNLTLFNSLVNGTLESLSSSNEPAFFKPISILALPSGSGYLKSQYKNTYKNTLILEESDKGCSGGMDNIPPGSSLSLNNKEICSILSGGYNSIYELEYPTKCNSLLNCTPLSGDITYLPRHMSMHAIHCSETENEPGMQFVLEFPNGSYIDYYRTFDPKTTLLGEGSWDSKRNLLQIVACRIFSPSHSFGNAFVGDCSTRLSLSFPTVWSIRKLVGAVGQMCTNRTVNSPGFFDRIELESSDIRMTDVPGLKYEYTLIDKARTLCPLKKPGKGKEKYPSENSYNLRFHMSIEASKGKFSWGSAFPIFIGDKFFDQNRMSFSWSEDDSEEETEEKSNNPMSVSYLIRFGPSSDVTWDGGLSSSASSSGRVEISAEGIYDDETGQLCMLGCRKLFLYAQKSVNDAMDCEILLNFQFPPLGGKSGRLIKGSISSSRKNKDPLYFKPLNISTEANYGYFASESIWRMDMEIVMVLISNTLSCVLVVFQIFYVRKHPDVLRFISLLMLVILSLGHLIPLVLNFEAFFVSSTTQNLLFRRRVGQIETYEVVVRVVTTVAFLLQSRLLQLVWTGLQGHKKKAASWVAERKTLFVSLPLYILGLLIAFLVNWRKNASVLPSKNYVQYSLWADLRSFGGLVVDGFLFPQIILNVFLNSNEKVLSSFFYIGNTLVRLVPHAYDLYRAYNYNYQPFYRSYIYADPRTDFYSTAWDIIISCVGFLFAVMIYLQQRFGGVYVVPRRFRRTGTYENVPVVGDDANYDNL